MPLIHALLKMLFVCCIIISSENLWAARPFGGGLRNKHIKTETLRCTMVQELIQGKIEEELELTKNGKLDKLGWGTFERKNEDETDIFADGDNITIIVLEHRIFSISLFQRNRHGERNQIFHVGHSIGEPFLPRTLFVDVTGLGHSPRETKITCWISVK